MPQKRRLRVKQISRIRWALKSRMRNLKNAYIILFVVLETSKFF